MTPVVVALARTRLALLALALLGVAAASVATLLYEQHRWLAILTGMSYLSLLLQVAKQLFARRHPAVYTRASGASALALEPALKYLRLSPLVCVLSLGR